MGVRFPSIQSNTLVNANVGINAETAVVTTPPLNISLDFATIIILWSMTHTVGTTATASRYFLRRGSGLGGTQIYASGSISGAAGNVVLASQIFFDTPGAVAGQQYTLSCIDPGSTVAGAIADANIFAFAL